MSNVYEDQLLEAAATIRYDRVHGAMELATRAVRLAVDLIATQPTLAVPDVARALASARPSMAAIGNAIALTLAPFTNGADTTMLHQEAERRVVSWQDDNRRLFGHARAHIPKEILTYSHASTTRNVFLALRDHFHRVIIPEGRPVDDGKRFAEILAGANIPVTVITEAQMGWWVPHVEAVIVGADTVAPAGDVINHMGTATLALIAQAHNIPMYSLTHTLKIAPYDRPEDLREENDPREIWRDPPAGITVRNPAFDRTPANRIIVITERGILTDALRADIVAEHQEAWRTLGLE